MLGVALSSVTPPPSTTGFCSSPDLAAVHHECSWRQGLDVEFRQDFLGSLPPIFRFAWVLGRGGQRGRKEFSEERRLVCGVGQGEYVSLGMLV